MPRHSTSSGPDLACVVGILPEKGRRRQRHLNQFETSVASDGTRLSRHIPYAQTTLLSLFSATRTRLGHSIHSALSIPTFIHFFSTHYITPLCHRDTTDTDTTSTPTFDCEYFAPATGLAFACECSFLRSDVVPPLCVLCLNPLSSALP